MSLTNLPKRVTIELTNHCNRTCVACPRIKTTYPLGNMTYELFTKILAQLPSNTVIVPFFRGESLLYPYFADAMEKLSRFQTVQLATNGDRLSQHAENILLGCSFLSLSLHEFRNQPQRATEQFFHVAKSKGVTTQVSILESLIPTSKKQKFVKSWLKHLDRVRIYIEHSKNSYGDTYRNIQDNGEACQKPFSDMVVYWDGKVALCNHDWQNLQPLGDLNTQTVQEVWLSEAYQTIRNKHKKGKRKQVHSCQNCDFWSKQTFGELYTNGTFACADDS